MNLTTDAGQPSSKALPATLYISFIYTASSLLMEGTQSCPDNLTTNIRVGLEKPSTISVPCKPPGDQANVGDHDPSLR